MPSNVRHEQKPVRKDITYRCDAGHADPCTLSFVFTFAGCRTFLHASNPRGRPVEGGHLFHDRVSLSPNYVWCFDTMVHSKTDPIAKWHPPNNYIAANEMATVFHNIFSHASIKSVDSLTSRSIPQLYSPPEWCYLCATCILEKCLPEHHFHSSSALLRCLSFHNKTVDRSVYRIAFM